MKSKEEEYKNFQEQKDEFDKEIANYVKRDDIKFNDLSEKEKQKLTEDVALKSKVDGTDKTWKELLEKIGNNIKLLYLRTQKKFADVWTYYNTETQLAALRANKKPAGIDTIRDKEGHEIKENALTDQVITNIKKAFNEGDEKNKAYVDLYDPKDNKLVNDTNYNLSKINDYQVALVLPDALLKTK